MAALPITPLSPKARATGAILFILATMIAPAVFGALDFSAWIAALARGEQRMVDLGDRRRCERAPRAVSRDGDLT